MTTIEVTIGSSHETFVLAETDAPKVYDHGAVIELMDTSYDGKTKRYVLIPASALNWQRLRNASGLHTLVTEDLLVDALDAARELWKRIRYGIVP